MENIVVEVGLILGKDIEYYNDLIAKKGAENMFNCETHDIYFTNKSHNELEKMTENQIKKACVRFRMVNCFGGTCFNGDFNLSMSFDNFKIFDETKEDRFKVGDMKQFKKIQAQLEKKGWYLIFDTFKVDYQYRIGDMKSRIQFQEIDNIGLVLYYDNPDYYEMSEDNQREMLINELNDYGFEFDKNTLGIDKLRTLLTGHSQFSKNQNG